MAYEYESRLKNRLLDLEFDTWEETAQFEREYRELQEVYRKAKAFCEIREIEKTSDITGYYENTQSYMYDVESVIEKYDMEDE
ncbi:hypothetical protein [Staphylococcus shinii]|uniref:hypothetical protein n=1 Tax=Staphylococcus shinii TaxID=2912228 RepID=UPI003F575A1F